MANLIIMLLRSLLTGVQSQAVMRAEIIALRHQLIVLQRTQKTNRLVLGRADRCLWVWLSRLWSRWRSALIIVKPATVVRWHRQGFQSTGLGRFVTAGLGVPVLRGRRVI